ncbi:hypothetical protein FO519_010331, partial [Halicephalobus sp. NKZ332]
MPNTAEGTARKGKLQQIQELRSRLRATDDLKEKANIYAQLLELPGTSIDSPSENVDPQQDEFLNLEEFEVPVEKAKERVQAIPLLPSGVSSRGITVTSFEPSAEECSSITSSEEVSQVRRESNSSRSRNPSISSSSSVSSRLRKENRKRHRSTTPGINEGMNSRPLTPEAQRRVFNYEFRGPIPAHHHCRRSLFGSGSIDIPQMETPKKSRISQKKIASKAQPRSRSFDRK